MNNTSSCFGAISDCFEAMTAGDHVLAITAYYTQFYFTQSFFVCAVFQSLM